MNKIINKLKVIAGEIKTQKRIKTIEKNVRIFSTSDNASIGPVLAPSDWRIDNCHPKGWGYLDLKKIVDWLIENEIYQFRLGSIQYDKKGYYIEIYFVNEGDALAAKINWG